MNSCLDKITVTNLVDAAIATRMSTRAFLPRPVAEADVSALLECAAAAGRHSDAGPWRAYVLRGESRATLCAKVCAAHDAVAADPSLAAQWGEAYDYYPRKWLSPYIERRRENGWGLYGLLGIGRADKDKMHAQHQRNYVFFDAPVGLIFTVQRTLLCKALPQYGMFLQNIMVAARLQGLHSCPQAAWNNFSGIILPHVEADASEVMVCGMALGYADEAAVVNTYHTPRVGVAEFTCWLD